MEENPKEYGIFYGLLYSQKNKDTYSEFQIFLPVCVTSFLIFSARRTVDRKTSIRKYLQKQRFCKPISELKI